MAPSCLNLFLWSVCTFAENLILEVQIVTLFFHHIENDVDRGSVSTLLSKKYQNAKTTEDPLAKELDNDNSICKGGICRPKKGLVQLLTLMMLSLLHNSRLNLWTYDGWLSAAKNWRFAFCSQTPDVDGVSWHHQPCGNTATRYQAHGSRTLIIPNPKITTPFHVWDTLYSAEGLWSCAFIEKKRFQFR